MEFFWTPYFSQEKNFAQTLDAWKNSFHVLDQSVNVAILEAFCCLDLDLMATVGLEFTPSSSWDRELLPLVFWGVQQCLPVLVHKFHSIN